MRLLHRTFSLVCVVALAAGCDSPTSTQLDVDAQLAKGGGGVVAMATGSGVRAGSIRHFQFSAILKADGSVSGQFNLTNEGTDNFSAHGEILCIRVEGNRAWIGSRLTHSSNPAFVGREGGFYTEDNGEGNEAAPDRLSLTFVNGEPGLAQAVCDFPFPFDGTVDIDKGNIQVH